MGKIVWTRSTGDWTADVKVIGDHDFILSMPATEQVAVASSLHLPDNSVCIISSQKAVEYMVQMRPDLTQALKLAHKIMCFGAKTREAISMLGLSATLEPKCHSLAELCEYIARKYAGMPVCYIGAKDSAFDVDGFFSRQKMNFVHLALYETLPLDISDSLQQLLMQEKDILFCVASPSACDAVLKSLPTDPPANARLEFLCIGKTTAQKLVDSSYSYQCLKKPSIESMAITALEWYNKLSKRGS